MAVYGGLNTVAVGENGGCITHGANDHVLLGDKAKCTDALQLIRSKLSSVKEKPVFPRLTEVVLERTFDIEDAKKIIGANDLDVVLSDSQYAIHINSSGINKASGFKHVMKMLDIYPQDVISIGDSDTDVPLFELASMSVAVGNALDSVKSNATMAVRAHAGDGVIEALDKLAPLISEM